MPRYGGNPVGVNRLVVHGRKRHRGRRGLLVLAAVVGATLLGGSGQAYAQTTPPDSGGVDQYVEDVPTAGGSHVPGKGPGKHETIKPSVATQIDELGGVDAPVLTEVATSSDYGAGPKTAKPGARGEDVSAAAAIADVSSRATAASAVSAVQGAGTTRLAGFLLLLFGISVATVIAAALRQRRAAVRE